MLTITLYCCLLSVAAAVCVDSSVSCTLVDERHLTDMAHGVAVRHARYAVMIMRAAMLFEF